MLPPGTSYYGASEDVGAAAGAFDDIGLGEGGLFSFAQGMNAEMVCMVVALFLVAAMVLVVLVLILLLAFWACYKMTSEDYGEGGVSLAGYASSWGRSASNTKGEPVELGAVGLHNLGNTCYMNSTLQCLSHIPQMRALFASGEYERRLNEVNPLGTKGEVAKAYGQLMSEMWSGEFSAVAPMAFKETLGTHAPQFTGYQQHDSQELLAQLLDKLHEDVNQGVKTTGGGHGGADLVEALATVDALEHASHVNPIELEGAKAWLSHLQRNESPVSKLFQGQAMSSLACTNAGCGHVATSFDTFMYLNLSLPPEYQSFGVEMVCLQDGRFHMKRYVMRLRKSANITDLKKAVRAAKLVPKSYQMRVCVVYGGRPNKLPNTTSLAHMGRSRLFMYLRPPGTVAMLPIIHRRAARVPREQTYGYYYPDADDQPDEVVTVAGTGIPCIMPLSATTTLADVHATALRWAASSCSVDFDDPHVLWTPAPELGYTPRVGVCDQYGSACYRRHDRCRACRLEPSSTLATIQQQNGDGSVTTEAAFPAVCIDWGTSDTDPEALTTPVLGKDVDLQPITSDGKIEEEKSDVTDPDADDGTEAITLARCLDKYYKPEVLGAGNRWKCPECKTPVSARKSMALWRLPDVVVIVLKRFNFQGANNYGSKLETLVEFPIRGLDLRRWVAGPVGADDCMLYDLFAVSNHSGTLSGGHYTAMCSSFSTGVWYSFNDTHVSVVGGSAEAQDEETLRRTLRTKSAYVLMYHRRGARGRGAHAAAPSRSGPAGTAGAGAGAGAAAGSTSGGAAPGAATGIGAAGTGDVGDGESSDGSLTDDEVRPPSGPRPTSPASVGSGSGSSGGGDYESEDSLSVGSGGGEYVEREVGGTGVRERARGSM